MNWIEQQAQCLYMFSPATWNLKMIKLPENKRKSPYPLNKQSYPSDPLKKKLYPRMCGNLNRNFTIRSQKCNLRLNHSLFKMLCPSVLNHKIKLSLIFQMFSDLIFIIQYHYLQTKESKSDEMLLDLSKNDNVFNNHNSK